MKLIMYFIYLIIQAITINSNLWTDSGHSINQIYDVLYMMDRDDITVGVGGEGGILPNGDIEPNVGGYLPIIEQVSHCPQSHLLCSINFETMKLYE